MTPEKIPYFGRNSFYTILILYTCATTFPKISVLVLYLRIFVDRPSRFCSWLLIGVLSVAAIVNIFTVGFQCTDPAAAWKHGSPGSKCNNIQAHFSYASLVTATIRFAQFIIHPIARDPTYEGSPLFIWLTVEPSIYLICACLLACRPILTKLITIDYFKPAYTWLRQSTSRVKTNGDTGRGGVTQNSTGNRKDGSVTVFGAEGDYYKLEPPKKPVKIHIQRDYTVNSVGPHV